MEEEESFDEALDVVVEYLQSKDANERLEGTGYLCEWINTAYGEVGAALGEAIRERDCVAPLLKLWSDAVPLVQQRALLVLGNLCSDKVDSQSALTKAILLSLRAETVLLDCSHSEDQAVVHLACAALQNLCQDTDWAHAVVGCGFLPRLEELVRHKDEQVVRYVAGALQNLLATLHATERGSQLRYLSQLARETVLARVQEAAVEEFRQRRAMRVLATAVQMMPAHVRIARVNRARRAMQEAQAAIEHEWRMTAAVVIQATARRRLAWREVEAQQLRKARKAAEMAAEKKRQEEARREAERKEAEERFAREEAARREAEQRAADEAEARRKAAALVLQAASRRRQAVHQAASRRAAVPVLIAGARGRAVRRRVAAQHRAIARLQASRRARRDRLALARSKRAAVSIQAAVRRHLARRELARLREQERIGWAVVAVQAAWRRKAVWLRLARRLARIQARDEQRRLKQEALDRLTHSHTVSSKLRVDETFREKLAGKGMFPVPHPPSEPAGDGAAANPSPRKKSVSIRGQGGALESVASSKRVGSLLGAARQPGGTSGGGPDVGGSQLPSRAVAHDVVAENGLAMTRFSTVSRLLRNGGGSGAAGPGTTPLAREAASNSNPAGDAVPLRLPRLAKAAAPTAAPRAPTTFGQAQSIK